MAPQKGWFKQEVTFKNNAIVNLSFPHSKQTSQLDFQVP